jgi:hypothetical protein
VAEYEEGLKTIPNAKGVRIVQDLPAEVPPDLDRDHYAREARKWLQSVPGFPHFDPKHLDPRARRLHDLGLRPVPKRGKLDAPGCDHKRPTYLWDWERYPTLGTATGLDSEVLVLDIDDPAKWRAWLRKGPGGSLAGPERLLSLGVGHGLREGRDGP